MAPTNSKGKRKASEQTPLLEEHGSPAGDTSSEIEQIHDSQPAAVSRQVWRSHLLTAALCLLTVFFGLILAMILLTESYAAPAWRNIDRALSQPGGDEFWKKAVPMHAPDAVNVVGVDRTEDEMGVLQLQVNMSVVMRMTIDTDFIMGFRNDNSVADGWWMRKWKDIGRWGIRRLGSTTAMLDNITVYPSNPTTPGAPLLTIKPISPISITLSPGLSPMDHASHSSFKSVSIPFLVLPSQNASFLQHFVEQSWANAFINVRMHGSGLQIYGGHIHAKSPSWWNVSQWRTLLRLKKSAAALELKLPIPPLHIPSHPPTDPGSGLPALSDLLTLESFAITSAPSPVIPQPVPSTTPQASRSTSINPGLENVNPDIFLGQQPLRHEKSSISSARLERLPSHSFSDIKNIIITARASLAHPFSSFASKLDLPVQPFPFMIALPLHQDEGSSISALSYTAQAKHTQTHLISVAQVYASPSFNTTHIRIPISGYLLPMTNSSFDLADAISMFAGSYLSYKPAAIAISTPLYPSLVVRTSFPPPTRRLELIKNVTIENMSIRPALGPVLVPDLDWELVSKSLDSPLNALEILASATVHARVVLPPGVNIDINVVRLWIDCLVFDGEVPEVITSQSVGRGHIALAEEQEPAPVPESGAPPIPTPRPLPDPLPERAFGRITPRTWLMASSSRIPPGDQSDSDTGGVFEEFKSNSGTNVFVTAKIVDVPLAVLPGRGDELSKFVAKVLFSSDPVVAGIQGIVAVGVRVPGLTSSGTSMEGNELVLTGLPFEGNMKVGGRKY